MAVCYKRLWKLLIDRDLKKKDLEEMAGVSHYTMNKLTRGENVTTDILCRICSEVCLETLKIRKMLCLTRLASAII